MKISVEKFNAAGRAVYGRTWKANLGHRLGISRQQVHKWSTGEDQIPRRAVETLLKDYLGGMVNVWELARDTGIKMPRRPAMPVIE